MPDSPEVSVVIAAYNGAEFLAESIDSALSQEGTSLEVIVVDDGSTDSTPEVCLRYGDKIRYVRKANGGTPSARNEGLRVARGEFLALLDQDDLYLPGKLAAQVGAMRTDARIGLVHTGGRVIDYPSGQTTSEYVPAPELGYHDLLEWCVVGCATTMMRRSVVAALGGFDESLRGADDWDLWIRIAREHRVVGLPEIYTVIREHGGNQGHRYRRMYPIARAVVEKHRGYHADCAECRKASASALRRLRRDYFAKALRSSETLASQGEQWQSLTTRLDALRVYPEGLPHLAKRLLSRHTSHPPRPTTA